MVIYACNLSTWEAEAEGLPRIQEWLGLHSELQATQSSSKDNISKEYK